MNTVVDHRVGRAVFVAHRLARLNRSKELAARNTSDEQQPEYFAKRQAQVFATGPELMHRRTLSPQSKLGARKQSLTFCRARTLPNVANVH